MSNGIMIKNTMRNLLSTCRMEMAGSGINPEGWEMIIGTIKKLCREWAQASATVNALEDYIAEHTGLDFVKEIKEAGTAKKYFKEMYPEEWEEEK